MPETRLEYYLLAFLMMILTIGLLGFQLWMRERRRDALMKADERASVEGRERRRLDLEEKRLEAEESARYSEERARDQAADRATAQNSGAGSGGYIVIELPEKERPMFHDLLKGFEDYAKLKGYHIAFSIDSSHEGRIAFKFTVKNDGFVVGQERVRQDFKEYIEQVRTKDIDELDKLPVITSIEEHHYLVAVLKSRLSFLQHSYKLAKTTATYYESLIMGTRSFPALPHASVIVQTGGNMDSRKYEAVNSQRLIQGDSNTYTDSSVNIGQSFNERQERIAALDDYIGVCCWKDRPLQLHNPAVEQLLPDGKWFYVGGAYQDLPAPFWKKLEPGTKFQGEIRIIDPYRKLSVPGGFDMQPGYSLPISGKHRARITYSHARPIYPNDAKERPRNAFVNAYSDPFDIPSKENPSTGPHPKDKEL
jgi:hypothetical protein